MELRIGVLNSLETNGEIDLEAKKELRRSAPTSSAATAHADAANHTALDGTRVFARGNLGGPDHGRADTGPGCPGSRAEGPSEKWSVPHGGV